MKSSEDKIIQQIKTIKNKISIQSSQVESFLFYLDQQTFKKSFTFCGGIMSNFSSEFTKIYQKLNQQEKNQYYYNALRIAYQIGLGMVSPKDNFQQEKMQVLYRDDQSAKRWKKTYIFLDYSKKSIFVDQLKVTIKLQNFLIRQSKCKQRQAFVLQAVKSGISPQIIRLSHLVQIQTEKLKTTIKKMVYQAIRQKIGRMMGTKRFSKRTNSLSLQIVNVENNRRSIRQLLNFSNKQLDLTPERYNEISSNLVNEETINNIDDYSDFTEIKNCLYLSSNETKVKKKCCLPIRNNSLQEIIISLTDEKLFKHLKSCLFMVSLIGEVISQKTKFYHQICRFSDGAQCDFVYLRHMFTRGQITYFIDKSIQTQQYGSHTSSPSRGNIVYSLWKISKKQTQIQITVEIQINSVKSNNMTQIMSQFIGEIDSISSIKLKTKSSASFQILSFQDATQEQERTVSKFTSYAGLSPQQTEFFSVYTPSQQTQKLQQIWELDQSKICENPISVKSPSKKDKYYYAISPKNENRVLRQFKGDLFFDSSEAIVNDKGDLVFVNETKIKAQSSVMKSIVKKIGTNIFSGKSPINISLPIQIFGPDTNLQRLCRSTAYAPVFLQNHTNSSGLDRLKAALSFLLGTIILYIDMAKPFNPILGETYQCFIDGCPVYGQQISHHPPISSLLFYGRGYYVSANLQAKVDFGLNSASGSNQGTYKIAFSSNDKNKNEVLFNSPPGQLSGVVYGQRKLCLTKKTKLLDIQQGIFVELTWGPGKNKNTIQRYHDYVQGKIVKLSKKYNDLSLAKEGGSDQILGYITGRWTDTVYFNQQPIFQTNIIKPCVVVQQINPLESDSFWRDDRRCVQKGDMSQGQKFKQQLEQIQRKDRKLRQNNKK